MKKTVLSIILSVVFLCGTTFLPCSAQGGQEGFSGTLAAVFAAGSDSQRAISVASGLTSDVTRVPDKKVGGIIENYAQLRASSFGTQHGYENRFSAGITQDEARRADALQNAFSARGVTIEEAYTAFRADNVEKDGDNYIISAYEWTFYVYCERGFTDISGYGTEHVLTIEGGILTQDSYQEDTVAYFASSSYVPEKAAQDLLPEPQENPPVVAAKAFTYSVPNAVSYADKYAMSYNPAYSNYNSVGGDCANFVSQCMYAGGLPKEQQWYWYSYEQRTGSWIGSTSQFRYLSAKFDSIINPASSQIRAGNPVYYSKAATGTNFDHAAICVGKNAAGTPVVNAHNNDRYRVDWMLGTSWAKRGTVLLTDKLPTAPVISVDNTVIGKNQQFTVNWIEWDADTTYTIKGSYNGSEILSQESMTGEYTVLTGQPGKYEVYVNAKNAVGTVKSNVITVTVLDEETAFSRLSGRSRYDTAVRISEEGWLAAETVVLANGLNYADALCGVPLAKAFDAPILLTAGEEALELPVLTRINELGAKKIIILGGSSAISEKIEQSLYTKFSVKRVSGRSRYDTAVAVSKYLQEVAGAADTAVIATGAGYADALSISSYAAASGYPILYADPVAGLGSSTLDCLAQVQNICIAGGESAVSKAAEEQLSGKKVERISGRSRYDTSFAILKRFSSSFGKDLILATGANFPDALAGGAFGAKQRIPVLLVNPSAPPEQMLAVGAGNYVRGLNLQTVYLLGGDKAVPDQAIINSIYSK